MVQLPGTLTIKTITGRYGDFNVATLDSEIGKFAIRDAVLDEYNEGTYQGTFGLTRIYSGSYQTSHRVVIETRAELSGIWLSDYKEEAVPSDAASEGRASPTKKSDCSIKSLIMPCNHIFLPSSGWYNRVIPYACNSSISSGNMVPPPPPNILMCPAPFSWSRSYMYLKYSMCPPW